MAECQRYDVCVHDLIEAAEFHAFRHRLDQIGAAPACHVLHFESDVEATLALGRENRRPRNGDPGGGALGRTADVRDAVLVDSGNEDAAHVAGGIREDDVAGTHYLVDAALLLGAEDDVGEPVSSPERASSAELCASQPLVVHHAVRAHPATRCNLRNKIRSDFNSIFIPISIFET